MTGESCGGSCSVRRRGGRSSSSGIARCERDIRHGHASDEGYRAECTAAIQPKQNNCRLDVVEDRATVYLLLPVEGTSQPKLVAADDVVPSDRTRWLAAVRSVALPSRVTAVLVADLVGGTGVVADLVEDRNPLSPRRRRVVGREDVQAVALLVGPSGLVGGGARHAGLFEFEDCHCECQLICCI